LQANGGVAKQLRIYRRSLELQDVVVCPVGSVHSASSGTCVNTTKGEIVYKSSRGSNDDDDGYTALAVVLCSIAALAAVAVACVKYVQGASGMPGSVNCAMVVKGPRARHPP